MPVRSDLSVADALLVQVIALTPTPASEAYLRRATGLSGNSVKSSLKKFTEKNSITHDDKGLWSYCGSEKLQQEAAAVLRTQLPKNDFGYYLGMLTEDLALDYAETFVRQLSAKIKAKNKQAICIFELVLLYFLRLGKDPRLDTEQQCVRYIETAILLQMQSVTSELYVDLALKFSPICWELSLRFNFDIPTVREKMAPLPIIKSEGTGEGHFSAAVFDTISEPLPHSVFESKGFSALPSKLDVIPSIDYVRHLLYDSVAQKAELSNTTIGQLLLQLVETSSSYTTMLTRRFAMAIDSIDTLRTIAADGKNSTLSELWLCHYSFALLRKNELDIALEHLNELFTCLPYTDKKSYVAASAIRGVALYHFLCNRLESSYRILNGETRRLIALNLPHAEFIDPLIFDMLFTLELQGYPPIPRYELDIIIPAARQTSNSLLKGAALRIEALRMRRKGENLQIVIDLLRESQSQFHPERDTGNLSLTLHELSNTLPLLGQYEEAQELRSQVTQLIGYELDATTPYRSAVLLGTGVISGDQALLSYAEQRFQGKVTEQPELTPSNASLLTRSLSSFKEFPADASLDDILRHMANIFQGELRCTFAAFFLPTEEKYRHVAVKNGKDSRPMRQQLLRYQDRLNELTPEEFDSFSWESERELCFFFDCGDPLPWVLYLWVNESSGLLFPEHDDEIAMLAKLLASDVRKVLRLHQSNQKKQAQLSLPTTLETEHEPGSVLGTGMKQCLSGLNHVIPTEATVLLLGETGVGKELVALHVHKRSGRTGPFIAVHPASTPETLFESEFFGHERGAYTGAVVQRSGFFELAHNGTLFIDEVGDMPFAIQTKLLRVLQDKNFMRVGGNTYLHSNFRLITATNRNLWEDVQKGLFRKDLFYRIAVFPTLIPPLRNRQQDIELLVKAFMAYFSKSYSLPNVHLNKPQIEALNRYSWPGNVRELKNLSERMILSQQFLLPDHVQQAMKEASLTQRPLPKIDEEIFSDMPSLKEVEKRYLRLVLEKTGGKVRGSNGAGALLNMSLSTLYAKLKAHNLS